MAIPLRQVHFFYPWTLDQTGDCCTIAGGNYWLEPGRWNRQAEQREMVWRRELDTAKEGRRSGYSVPDPIRPERLLVICELDVFAVPPTLKEDVAELVNLSRLRLFALIENTPYLDWLLCTRNRQNVASLVPDTWMDSRHGFPANVHIGERAGAGARGARGVMGG